MNVDDVSCVWRGRLVSWREMCLLLDVQLAGGKISPWSHGASVVHELVRRGELQWDEEDLLLVRLL